MNKKEVIDDLKSRNAIALSQRVYELAEKYGLTLTECLSAIIVDTGMEYEKAVKLITPKLMVDIQKEAVEKNVIKRSYVDQHRLFN